MVTTIRISIVDASSTSHATTLARPRRHHRPASGATRAWSMSCAEHDGCSTSPPRRWPRWHGRRRRRRRRSARTSSGRRRSPLSSSPRPLSLSPPPPPPLARTQIVPPCSSTNFRAERQAEPGALALARVVVADLAELLEHAPPGPPARCRRRCRVTEISTQPSRAPRAHVDPAALRRELDRVGQQVEEHLLDLALVGARSRRAAGRRRAPSAMPWRLRPLAHQGQRVVERASAGRSRRQLQLHAAGLDLRQVEDVVDQRQQVPARGVDVAAGTRPACR